MVRNFYPAEVYQIQQLLHENPSLKISSYANEPIGFRNDKISKKTIHHYFKDILKEYHKENGIGVIMMDDFIFKYESFDTNLVIFHCDNRKSLIKYLNKYKIPHEIIGDYQNISIKYINNYVAYQKIPTPVKYYVKDVEPEKDEKDIMSRIFYKSENIKSDENISKLLDIFSYDSTLCLNPPIIVKNSVIRHYNRERGGIIEINVGTNYRQARRLHDHYAVKFIYDKTVLYYVDNNYHKYKVFSKDKSHKIFKISKLLFEDYGIHVEDFKVLRFIRNQCDIKDYDPFIVLKRIKLKGK